MRRLVYIRIRILFNGLYVLLFTCGVSGLSAINKTIFSLYTTPVSWPAAYNVCQSGGGTLLDMSDPYKRDLIQERYQVAEWTTALSPVGYAVWIGLFDADPPNQHFIWSNSCQQQTDWTSPQPTSDEIRCITATDVALQWNPTNCNEEKMFICEYQTDIACDYTTVQGKAFIGSLSYYTNPSGATTESFCQDTCLIDPKCWGTYLSKLLNKCLDSKGSDPGDVKPISLSSARIFTKNCFSDDVRTAGITSSTSPFPTDCLNITTTTPASAITSTIESTTETVPYTTHPTTTSTQDTTVVSTTTTPDPTTTSTQETTVVSTTTTPDPTTTSKQETTVVSTTISDPTTTSTQETTAVSTTTTPDPTTTSTQETTVVSTTTTSDPTTTSTQETTAVSTTTTPDPTTTSTQETTEVSTTTLSNPTTSISISTSRKLDYFTALYMSTLPPTSVSTLPNQTVFVTSISSIQPDYSVSGSPVVDSSYSRPVDGVTPDVTLNKTCFCSCKKPISNLTESEKKVLVERLLENLTVNISSLNSTRRRYISVQDDRPSARAVGYSGVAIISVCVVFPIIFDFDKIIIFISNIKK